MALAKPAKHTGVAQDNKKLEEMDSLLKKEMQSFAKAALPVWFDRLYDFVEEIWALILTF